MLLTIGAGRTRPLTIVGPRGLRDMITTVYRYSSAGVGYPIDWIELGLSSFHLCYVTIHVTACL
jgi:ribonuclease BN (tRNA processing enzyme)